ncbi:MAG: mechanosensitive ion channel [Rikenellaceae bacterium]
MTDSTSTTVTNLVDSIPQTPGDIIQVIKSTSVDGLMTFLITNAVEILSKIVLAAIIYIAGRWVIKKLTKVTSIIFEKRKVDFSLSKFILSLINISLSAMLLLTVVGVLGINTSSFLAIFASAGLAIGMTLSGTLQNFAGGVMVLLLKPYKIGDVIEAEGFLGIVKEISLFSTLINTFDNKMVIIPNGGLSTGIINNYSKESTRRVDWSVSVAYGTESDKVESVIKNILDKHPLVMQDRDKFVAMNALADSSVDFVVRAWTASENYWDLYFSVTKEIYERFYKEGIEFPFPQLDVNIKK